MESCVSAQVDYNSHESRIVSDGRSAIKMGRILVRVLCKVVVSACKD
jgi:hypothetical protein